MATALITPPVSTATDSTEHAASTTQTSPMVTALTTAAVCIALVWVATAVLLLALTSTSMWGAIGVGAYAAFWLGGGFGTIFGSAAVFGKDH
ncbi:MAG: hypothetical protein AAFO29_08180 [Actinomycetota bacterium]